MVKVMDYRKVQKDNETFRYLVLQGGVEAVKSEKTGKLYFTARTTSVPAILDDATCLSLIGTELPGDVKKVPCELYEYKIKETSEVVQLDYRYEYVSETDEIIQEHLVDKKKVK